MSEWKEDGRIWGRADAVEALKMAIAESGAPKRLKGKMKRWLGWMAASDELVDYMADDGFLPLSVSFEDPEDHSKGWEVSRLVGGKWSEDRGCPLSDEAAEAIAMASGEER